MLLRRPFAFLIKHFKAIHLVLGMMIAYTLLKTNDVFRFIEEYLNTTPFIIGNNVVPTLFKPIMLVIMVAILVLTFVILGVMNFKKKPITFYIFNILVYSFAAFTLVYCYTNIKTLEVQLLDVRTLKLMRDFSLFSLIFQSLSLITVGIRATGFDIKKFDFDQDIEDLKITAEDNEEFEIDVELDTDRLKRNIRKKIRHAKYVYVENKLIIHIILSVIVGVVCFAIYLNVGVYHKVYKQNEPFTTTEFMLNVTNSYITNRDYHNHIIEKGKKLLVIQYEVRSKYEASKKTFKPERFALSIGKQKFHDVDIYKEKTYDLGNPYRNAYITTTFQKYTLTYELPETLDTGKITLKYKDTNDKEIAISITPVNDENKELVATYTLNQEANLQKSILKESKIKINSYEIGQTFVSEYNYCLSTQVCLPGIEYIHPSASGSSDKTLLKIEGSFTLDETLELNPLGDLYTVLRDFGSIRYEIRGETKVLTTRLQQVKPSRQTTGNIYYIEVPKELEEAEHITILFTLREFIYEFVVK